MMRAHVRREMLEGKGVDLPTKNLVQTSVRLSLLLLSVSAKLRCGRPPAATRCLHAP
jgi:hypothetical protein